MRMLIDWVPGRAGKRAGSLHLLFHLFHLGTLGLFGFAILDSMPLPTFGGADILTAVLAAGHRAPWYEYAAAATAGSLIGAYLNFRLARQAGYAYLHKRFRGSHISAVSRLLERWGTVALAICAGVPFPFPTTIFFAVAGASGYNLGRYLLVVGICRALRFSLVAFLAEHYGRNFIGVIRHPAESVGWLLLVAALIAAATAGAMTINRHLERHSSAAKHL
jgi:membrane protein YqaA with SNARE-associated domain